MVVLAALVLSWSTAAAAAERFDRGLLWSVTGAGAAASYVFGTIHVGDPRVTQLPALVARALAESSSVTVEAELEPSSLVAVADRMVFRDGRTLPAVAGTELYQKATRLTEKLGLPEPAVRLFRPWALALMLSVPPQNPAEVLDVVLAGAARAQGKPVYQLEGLEEQVGIFDGMPETDQVALLRHAVDEWERMPRITGRLIEAWLARDLAGMRRIGDEAAGDTAEARRPQETFTRRLLNERNVRMADRMQARFKEGAAFVAVGALHLQGEHGVLAELERRGWRVTRVY